jgi:hypothetical protein
MPWRHMREWRYSCTILDVDTRWRWAVSFTPWPLYPMGIGHGTHWIGGWVGPRAGLDSMKKKKYLASAGSRNPAVQPVARRCTASAIPDPFQVLIEFESMRVAGPDVWFTVVCINVRYFCFTFMYHNPLGERMSHTCTHLPQNAVHAWSNWITVSGNQMTFRSLSQNRKGFFGLFRLFRGRINSATLVEHALKIQRVNVTFPSLVAVSTEIPFHWSTVTHYTLSSRDMHAMNLE